MVKLIGLQLLVIILSLSCSVSHHSIIKEKGMRHLHSNLEFLASDQLEGREISTRGETLAAMYIAGELTKYGCKPFGDSGTYFENFNVLATSTDPVSNVEFFNNRGNVTTLSIGDDFYLYTEQSPSERYSNSVSDIVFAGYGVTADEYNYDDYKNLNVQGKVVLILNEFTSRVGEVNFTKEDVKHYGDDFYKINNAMEHGAVGVIILPDYRVIQYWRWIKAQALSTSFKLVQEIPVIVQTKELIPLIVISEESAIELMTGEEYSYDSLITLANKNEIPSGFELNKKVKMNYSIHKETRLAKNVIGLIEGTDDNLKNQYVVISAHYDHLGIRNGIVYNGADDDGSGTVAILEAARRLSCKNNNKRSILVVFHTGEEKGLFGSKYLTGHESFMSNVDADINIDMVGRESVDTIFSIGSNKLSSELHDLVKEVNSETVNFVFNYKYDDPNDPSKYYYRSDHYNYAKHNIPIVFFYDHMTADYHRPSDDVDKINFEKIEKVSTLVTELATRIANKDHKLVIDKTDENINTEAK